MGKISFNLLPIKIICIVRNEKMSAKTMLRKPAPLPLALVLFPLFLFPQGSALTSAHSSPHPTAGISPPQPALVEMDLEA